MSQRVPALGLIVIMLMSLFVFIPDMAPPASAATIYVASDGSQDYTSIGTAVDNAIEGDTIIVYPGIYSESTIEIHKTLTLKGQSPTGVTILGPPVLLNLSHADYTVIENLCLRWNESYPHSDKAISVVQTDFLTLNNIRIEDYKTGVSGSNSERMQLNKFSTTNGSNGINTASCSFITLRDCTLNATYYCLSFHGYDEYNYDHDIDTSNTMNGEPIHYLKHIDGQVLEGLDYNNLHIFHSNNFMIRDSSFNHGDGLRLYYCENVLMENLDFKNNTGDIRLWYSKGTVESCSSIDSSDGVYIRNTASETSLWIRNSTFVNSLWAVHANEGVISLENVAIINAYDGILTIEAGTLENVTFEDCECGIYKGNPGVVRLYNSTFKNCTTDIYYDAYGPSSLHHIYLVN
ncbi:MAG: hypothetical protein JSW28_05910, partial [Thermoplasmata archaeon]